MTIPCTHSAAFVIPGLRIASINDKVPIRSDEETIINSVCRFFLITKEDLVKKSRERPLPMARHVCFYLLIKHAGLYTTHIGKVFKKDHSTICHGNQVVKDQLSLPFDNEYKNAVEQILKFL